MSVLCIEQVMAESESFHVVLAGHSYIHHLKTYMSQGKGCENLGIPSGVMSVNCFGGGGYGSNEVKVHN